MPDLFGIFNTIKRVVETAPAVIAAAPQFVEVVQSVMPIFSGAQQEELKTALRAARERSDEAEADFRRASRGG